MPEAEVTRPETAATPRSLAVRSGGPELMPNNGRGRIPAARTADKTVVGARQGRLTDSSAEGGPAAPVREDGRGQGVGAKPPAGGTEPARPIGSVPNPRCPAIRA